MTLEEQANVLLDQAAPKVDAGIYDTLLSDRIYSFTNSSGGALAAQGRQDLVDQLDAAASKLSADTGDPALKHSPESIGGAPVGTSPFMAGLKTYVSDKNKIDTTYLKNAYDDAKKKILTDPLLLAVFVLGGVFIVAYAWRAFK